jgi:hypothetical protein
MLRQEHLAPTRIADDRSIAHQLVVILRVLVARPRRQSESGVGNTSFSAFGVRRAMQGAGQVDGDIAAVGAKCYSGEIQRLLDLRSCDVRTMGAGDDVEAAMGFVDRREADSNRQA